MTSTASRGIHDSLWSPRLVLSINRALFITFTGLPDIFKQNSTNASQKSHNNDFSREYLTSGNSDVEVLAGARITLS